MSQTRFSIVLLQLKLVLEVNVYCIMCFPYFSEHCLLFHSWSHAIKFFEQFKDCMSHVRASKIFSDKSPANSSSDLM